MFNNAVNTLRNTHDKEYQKALALTIKKKSLCKNLSMPKALNNVKIHVYWACRVKLVLLSA